MSLRGEIIGSCELGCIDGFVKGLHPCECMKKFRAYNRMVSTGFSKGTLDLINSENYQDLVYESGEDFVKFYLADLYMTEERGLSLFVYSRDRGRGKTTLAHQIIFEAVKLFSEDENYKSTRTYAFEHVDSFLSSFSTQKKKNEVSPLWQSTWYVLDDLGHEDRTAKWKKGILLDSIQRMLHYRRDLGLPTIITSNYAPGDLSSLYEREVDSLLEIQVDGVLGGERFRSVHVGGAEDFRLQTQNSAWSGMEKTND